MPTFELAKNIKVDFNSDCSTYVRCKLSKKRGQRIEFAAPKWIKDWLAKSGFGEDVVSKAVINGIYSTVFKIGPNPMDRFSGGSSMFANNDKLASRGIDDRACEESGS